MVWRTNFDRQLDGYSLATAVRQPGPAAATPAGGAGGVGAAPGGSPARQLQQQQAVEQPLQQQQFVGLGAVPVQAPQQQQPQQRVSSAAGGGDVGQQRDTRPASQHLGSKAGVAAAAAAAPSAAEDVLEVPPPMNLEGVPPSVAATLQHIVAQLDALVTVVGGLDLRLRDVEERVSSTPGGGV
jgi:centriolar protein POC1